MKIINDVLYSLVYMLFVALFLLAGAHGQTQGFAPYVPDGYNDGQSGNVGCTPAGGTSKCSPLVEGVQQDDLIICSASQEFISGPTSGCNGGSPPVAGTNPPWTMVDSLGTNLSMQTSAGLTVDTQMQVGITCAASTSSTYQVNQVGAGSFCADALNCIRVKNVCTAGTFTLDGAIQSATSTKFVALDAATTTFTTTASNDFAVEISAHSLGGGGVGVPNGLPPFGMAVGDGSNNAKQIVAWSTLPTVGSNTASMISYDLTNNIVLQSLAFKVPAIITDSAMPQGGVGTAYGAQLHCQGLNTSNPNYLLLSGSPGPGISFNSDGSFTGTPTVAGFYTFTAACTDGATISSNRTLTIQIGAALNTVTIDATTLATNFNAQPATFTVNASCGDLVDLRLRASDDTHFGQGYLQTINGTQGYFKDDVGSQVQQFRYNGGDNRGPMTEVVIGPILQAGTRTITVANGTFSSSGIAVYQTLIHGSQGVLDTNNAISQAVHSPTTTISLPLTLQVPNELVYVQFASTDNTSTTTTFSGTSGSFSVDNTQNPAGNYAAGHAFITSPTTNTITATVTHPAGSCGIWTYCDQWSLTAAAFRPGLPFACPISPAPRHRSWLQ